MNPRSELVRRRLAAPLVALIGLVALDLAPRSGLNGELWMVWSFLGADAGVGIGRWLPSPLPMAKFVDSASDQLIPWMLAALAVAVVLGLSTAHVVAARLARSASLGMRVACVTAWAVALDPAIALFVATRDVQSATRYVDVGDLLHALGLGAIWIAFMLWRGPERRDVPDASIHSARDARPGLSLFGAMLVAALVPSCVSWFALDRWPLTNDEDAYLFGAELFARGELYQTLGGIADFFPSPQTVIEEGRLFLFTLPGHSAVLVPGAMLGIPELFPRLFAMLAVALTWSIAVRLDLARPTWAAWCLALSPAFLGVESLYLSHGTSLPCALLFIWCALGALDSLGVGETRRALASAALGGFALSIAFITRPVTALALAVPVLLLLIRERRPKIGLLVAVAILAALPALLWLSSVNHTLTGSAFRTAYSVYDRAGNAVYGSIDARTAASISAFNLARMSMWLCGVAPGLLLPIFGFGFAARGPRTWFIAALPISLFAFYVLHPFHGVPWVGPVYLSDGLPALALLTAQGLHVVEQAFGLVLRRALGALCIAGCALLLTTHFRLAHEEIELRQRPHAAARALGIRGGVVFVRAESSRARRLYPLHPPAKDDEVVFALDLGPRNAELLRALGGPPAWIYDPESDVLTRL